MGAVAPDETEQTTRGQLIVNAGFDLPIATAVALAADFHPRRLDDGDYLFHEGDPGTTLFVVEAGCVEAVTTSRDGRELVFGSMDPGAIIGELTIIDGDQRSASIRAIEPSLVSGISRRDFLRHAHETPDIGLALAKLCAQRALDLSQWASKTSFGTLEARLSTTLLKLLAADVEGEPVITITQQALSDRLGVSRESINKWLRSWERDGIVRLGRRSITVVDPKHLEAAALSRAIDARPTHEAARVKFDRM